MDSPKPAMRPTQMKAGMPRISSRRAPPPNTLAAAGGGGGGGGPPPRQGGPPPPGGGGDSSSRRVIVRTPSRVIMTLDTERGGRSSLSPLKIRFEPSLSS